MDSLRKSFKSNNSYRQLSRKINDGEEPILLEHDDDDVKSIEAGNRREVVVNVDRGENLPENRNSKYVKPVEHSNKVWRDSNYEFWKEENILEKTNQDSYFQQPAQDSSSKMVDQILHKQKRSGEMSLDMEEVRIEPHQLPTFMENQQTSSKEVRVSFQNPSETVMAGTRQRYSRKEGSSSSTSDDDEDSANSGKVLKCTSRAASIPKNSGLLRSKTKSRLIDPPPSVIQQQSIRQDRKSGNMTKSSQLKSGVLEKLGYDEDDEDPFFDEDIPDELARANLGPVTILQWVSLVVILITFIFTLTIPILMKQTVWQLHLWKWEVLILVLICGRLVSGWVIRILVFFIERNFLLRKRVLYFVYGVRKSVQNCLWLGLVLIAWHFIFDTVERESKTKSLKYVTKVLICLLVGTVIWLVKILLVKVLASSFHVSAYFDRIQDSLFNQYVIETLSGAPLIEIQQLQEEEAKVLAEMKRFQDAGATIPNDIRAAARINGVSDGFTCKSGKRSGCLRSTRIGRSRRLSGAISVRKDDSKQEEDGITIDHVHKLNQKNISAWNMKRLMNIVRHGSLSTLDESIPAANLEDESVMQIRSEYEAKAAAKKIFKNAAKPNYKYIYLVDLMRFMTENEALKAMSLFEGAKETNRVSRSSLKNWVVNAFRERRALSLTLNDTKTAVNKLHQMVNIVVGLIIVIIWLLILGIATTHLLVVVSSQLLLVVFIFGNTCKMIFEAIIFLFVMHPFDVGDRCEIDGVQMIVEEMNILTTVFLRFDNQKIMYPNTVLSTLLIGNYYRSPDMGDSVDFCIHIATPVEKVAVMKERIKGYIESKQDLWYPDPTVVLKEVEDLNKLKMSVWLRHRMNHQDMGERWVRRALVVEEMIKVFRELDIQYRMLPVDVNHRNMAALSSTRLPSTWV